MKVYKVEYDHTKLATQSLSPIASSQVLNDPLSEHVMVGIFFSVTVMGEPAGSTPSPFCSFAMALARNVSTLAWVQHPATYVASDSLRPC